SQDLVLTSEDTEFFALRNPKYRPLTLCHFVIHFPVFFQNLMLSETGT
ncbi:unnamed protein product, partial [Rotaria socialis]